MLMPLLQNPKVSEDQLASNESAVPNCLPALVRYDLQQNADAVESCAAKASGQTRLNARQSDLDQSHLLVSASFL